MKKTLCAALCLLLYFPVFAQSEDDFDIIQNAQGFITITRYLGKQPDIVIPQTIGGVRVTEIGDYAFARADFRDMNAIVKREESIRSVVIPNTVTIIRKSAFYLNEMLTSVVIPNSITVIEESAFSSCGLRSVTLSNRLTAIGDLAFFGNNLTEIQLPASLKTIGISAFNKNRITNLVIPQGVTAVGHTAFEANPLVSLVIPPSLARSSTKLLEDSFVGKTAIFGFCYAFPNNKTLVNITMPANVDDENMSINFEESFINFYKNQDKRAGTYFKNGTIWTVK